MPVPKPRPVFEYDKIYPIITIRERASDIIELNALYSMVGLQRYPTLAILSDLYYKIGAFYEKYSYQINALHYYALAADHDNVEAMYRMAYIYANGKSVWAMDRPYEVVYSPRLSKRWYNAYVEKMKSLQ